MANNNINFKINYQKGDTSALDSLKKELQEVKNIANNIDMAFTSEDIQKLIPAVSALENALNGAFDVDLNTINIQKFNNILAQSGMNIKKLQEGLAVAGVEGNQAFLHMTSQLMKFNTATKQTNQFLDGIATSLFNTIKWSAMSSVVNNVTGSIQKAFYYVKDLDRSLNDIQIVTGKSADDMAQFAVEANKAAKELAVTTKDYTEGSLIYYQQGLDDKTVKTLTDITAMTSNVTGQSMETVSEQLTAVWNGYQVANEAAKEGMGVYQEYVDKMAAVGATTASDLEELSVAMSKVASAASSMGVGFDDLNAQIATIVSVTRQAPESVGTALKTIYARLGDLKVDGVDEFGTKLGEVSSQLQTMGVNILDTNGDMRDMTSVMAEVAEKWNTWTSAQRQAAAVAMAGKRQYNNLVALFDNWDMYGEALETSMDAAGTLEKQQEIALDSLANKMDVLKATAEDLYDSLIDEDTIKSGVEGLTHIIQLLVEFADATGGLNNLLPLLGSTALRVFNEQIASGIGTVIFNLQTARREEELMMQNQAQLQAMFQNSALFQTTGKSAVDSAMAEGLEKLKNTYAELVPYQSIMTQEEKQQANYILELTEKVGVLNGKIAEQAESWKYSNSTLKIIDSNLIDNLSDITAITQEINKTERIAAEIESLSERVTKNNRLKNVAGQFTSFEKFLRSFFGELQLSEEQVKALTQRFEQLKNLPLPERLQKIAQELKSVGNGASEIVKLKSEMQNADDAAKQLGGSLKSYLDLKSVIGNITNTIGAVGQLASSLSMLGNLENIWNNENISDGQKFLQTIINLSMVIPMLTSSFQSLNSTLGITNSLSAIFNKIKQEQTVTQTLAMVTQANETRLLEKYATLKGITVGEISASIKAKISEMAATQALTTVIEEETAAQMGANAAMLANPIGLIIAAIGSLIAILTIAHNKAEEAKKDRIELAEKAKQEASEYGNLIDTHQQLIESYNDINKAYEEGTASKNELIASGLELVEAYDLESARLAALAGDYDTVAEAAKRAREEEEKELLNKDIEAESTQVESTKDEIKDIKLGKKTKDGYEVDFSGLSSADYELANDQAVKKAFEEVYGVADTTTVKIGETAGEIIDFYNKSIELQEKLKSMGKDTGGVYTAIQDSIDALKNNDSIDKLLEAEQTVVNDIISGEHLEEAIDLNSFSEKINTIKNNIQKQIDKGVISSTDDVDSLIEDYVLQINNSFARQFIIDQEIKNKVSEEFQNIFLDSFHKYDPDTQQAIIGLGFDFNNTDEIEQRIDDFAQFAQDKIQNSFNVSAGLQSGINETILKGKDINKSDWESLQSTVPNMEETLGDKDSFNNKSIGERIQLMEELNEKVRESNALAIEHYEKNKETSEEIKEDLQSQIDAATESLKHWENELHTAGSQEDIDEAKEKISELQSEIDHLTSQKYEVEVSLNMEQQGDNFLQSAIGEVITQADQLKMAAESIGEAWTVAADDVANFASAFPDLMDDVTWLEDGSIQLSQELVNTTLQGNEDIIQSNKNVILQSIDDKIKQLEAEKNFQAEKIKILQSLLDGTISEEQAEQDLAAATDSYKTELLKQGLIKDAEAVTEMTKNAADGSNNIIESLSYINDAINSIHQNFGLMMVKGASLVPFSKGSASGITVTSSGVSDTKPINNKLDDDTKQKIQEELDAAIARESEIDKEIASYYGLRSEVMKKASDATKASDRVQSGHAGKEDKSKSGGGGGKDKKDKDEKEWKDEFDRYWELKKAIDATDKAVQKLEKDQENLHGKELIQSLQNENELLETQKSNYEALLAAQNERAAALRAELGTMGVVFDASGAIVNYAEATANALAAYNKAIQDYNAELIDETTLGVYEKSFENFKKLLEEYDKLYYTEIQETQDKIDEAIRKQKENNLKAWEEKIKIKIDWQDLKKGWRNFRKEMEEDFTKIFPDLRINSKTSKKNAKNDKKKIGYDIDAIKEVNAEIDKMMAGGESSMFQSVSQAQEKLKELNQDLQNHAKELKEDYKEAWDNYLNGIDQVSEKLEQIQEQYENINSELEFQKQLIELLYGEDAYDLNAGFYEGQVTANSNRLNSLVAERDTWKQLFEESGASLDNMDQWTEAQKKLYDNWQAAQKNLNDLTLEQIKLLQDQYMNTVRQIIAEEQKAKFDGKQLEDTKLEWERLKEGADEYYDSVESAYQLQTLANKYNQSINDIKDLKQQKQLNELKEKELAMLENKEKLTEFDIQAANLRYEIALKQMALEDAQNNKTSMKLTRNEQGNWAYQYVADEEDVTSKKQDLLDSWNALYQLAEDAYANNMDKLLSVEEIYATKSTEYAEMAMSQDEEIRARAEQLKNDLDTWYVEQTKYIAEQNKSIRETQATATAGMIKSTYENGSDGILDVAKSVNQQEKDLAEDLKKTSMTDYREMADKAKETLEETRDDWKSTAQTAINRFYSDPNSVKKSTERTYNAIIDANKKYQTVVDALAIQVGKDFGESGIKGAIDKAANSTENLDEKTKELCDNGKNDVDKLKDYVDKLKEAWDSVKEAINGAISAIEEYLKKQGEANSQQGQTGGVGPGGGTETASTSGNNSGGRGGDSTPKAKQEWHGVYNRAAGVNPSTGVPYVVHRTASSASEAEKMFKKDFNGDSAHYAWMKTGGYTGEWGEDGRLAVLHQKELVLNKEDTENFLSGIGMIRDMASLNGSIEKSILRSIANMAVQVSGINPSSINTNNSTESNNNTFNITAEFPNANSVDDIRQAILTLPNIASQFINSNRR